MAVRAGKLARVDEDDASMPGARARSRRTRRALLWGLLVALLLVAQSALLLLTIGFEAERKQDRADAAAAAAAATVRRELSNDLQSLQSLSWNDSSSEQWDRDAAQLLRARRALLRIERRDLGLVLDQAIESPYGEKAFKVLERDQLEVETGLACRAAAAFGSPHWSRSYYVPLPGGSGIEVVDLCVPRRDGARPVGFLAATFSLPALLSEAGAAAGDVHELSFVDADGTRLARVGERRGAGVYVAERLIDVSGQSLRLRADSVEGRPGLIPNLTIALVLGMSIALFGVVLVLARDVRRRASIERRLAEELAFRQAMEDSLVTGLRARDASGRLTYANPAFCAMVGYSLDELRADVEPPYWPPEHRAELERWQLERVAGLDPPREGFETVFMRRSGERFPVMIYEAPLVDERGKRSGWMSAVVDLSAQRRVEELSRAQQERLQASARLASVGEMASLLSHELNQPLAAIASYATGSLNLLDAPDSDALAMVREAVQRIAEQAERAGRVIHSVHSFVRRREHAREAVDVDELIDAVLPLASLHAQRIGAQIEVDVPRPPPRVVCDRTLLEQVLLNLIRNGLQAMDPGTPPDARMLTLRARRSSARRVTFHVIDRGAGIAPELRHKLFTPFFTTRVEGMGLGLSLVRTVIEQHGGALEFDSHVAGADGVGYTEFRFTLPAATDA